MLIALDAGVGGGIAAASTRSDFGWDSQETSTTTPTTTTTALAATFVGPAAYHSFCMDFILSFENGNLVF